MISVIITAGGSSSRFQGQNKLLYNLNGQPVIKYSVDTFSLLEYVDEIIISANENIISDLRLLFSDIKKVKIIQGGACRQESVYKGLLACSKECSYVIIHDGARPYITKEVISECLKKAKETNAAIAAVKTIDTVKIVDDNGFIKLTPDRKTLWNAQTPQIFRYDLILKLHEKYRNKSFTDDALLFETEGLHVAISEGDYANIKITTINDVKK